MDAITDYYAVLGVPPNASASTIKTAFKKLALKYHPDVYKGTDAEERMRILLLAYQTLGDPTTRKDYDVRYSGRSSGITGSRGRVATQDSNIPRAGRQEPHEVSPTARRDRQRHYAFPDLSDGYPALLDLGDITYHLLPEEARTLKEQGMLRGIAPEAREEGDGKIASAASQNTPHHCHRCHHRWVPADRPSRSGGNTALHNLSQESLCPACKASDWGEYLLLRCMHCRAVFESEQIRDTVLGEGGLFPPYELFPLCPQCARSHWCPTEEARVEVLRQRIARRDAYLRLLWIVIAVIILVLLVVFSMLPR